MSVSLSTKEMTAYLKHVMELEVSLYTQERAISESQEYLNNKKPKLYAPRLRAYPKPKELQEPTKPDDVMSDLINVQAEQAKIKKGSRILSIFCIIIGISFLGFAAVTKSDFKTIMYVLSGVVILCGVLFEVLCAIKTEKHLAGLRAENARKIFEYKEEMKTYEDEMRKYQLTKEQEEQRCIQEKNKIDLEYSVEKEKAQAEYDKKVVAYSISKQAVDQMISPKQNTESTLSALYNLNIVFPKYWNMVAISTMYEYFASGRVTALDGPNGAYNLYEAELRQNIIINKLDEIITQLEEIKANQYVLYGKLEETNQTLKSISYGISDIFYSVKAIAHDTREISNKTNEILESSRITAFCAQVTAKNTEVLKYIELIKR